MFGLNKTWKLDPRLESDSFLIDSNGVYQTRLMNDQRWPWLMIIPIVHDAKDIDDLPGGMWEPLMQYLADVSRTLKAMGGCTSTNVATLSNIVTQLHWHVVGRSHGDPNWPGPVWGFEDRQPYSSHEAKKFIDDYTIARKQTVSWIKRY